MLGEITFQQKVKKKDKGELICNILKWHMFHVNANFSGVQKINI